MSVHLRQYQLENMELIDRFIILIVDDFGLEKDESQVPVPSDKCCFSPWKALREGNSHNIPASPSSTGSNPWQPIPHLQAPQAQAIPVSGALGPHHHWGLCSTALGNGAPPRSGPQVGCQKPKQLCCFPTFFIFK